MPTQKQLERFQRLLDKAGVRHFKAHEFFVLGGNHHNPDSRAYGLNTEPPEELWENMIPTAVVLDHCRARVGKPVWITNAYRAPAYNRALPGTAPYSRHMSFDAADIQSRATPRTLYKTLLQMRREGLYKGGLGGYNSFVHVDTRGHNATWGKRW